MTVGLEDKRSILLQPCRELEQADVNTRSQFTRSSEPGPSFTEACATQSRLYIPRLCHGQQPDSSRRYVFSRSSFGDSLQLTSSIAFGNARQRFVLQATLYLFLDSTILLKQLPLLTATAKRTGQPCATSAYYKASSSAHDCTRVSAK